MCPSPPVQLPKGKDAKGKVVGFVLGSITEKRRKDQSCGYLSKQQLTESPCSWPRCLNQQLLLLGKPWLTGSRCVAGWVAVAESHQRKQIGTRLVQHLMKIFYDEDIRSAQQRGRADGSRVLRARGWLFFEG